MDYSKPFDLDLRPELAKRGRMGAIAAEKHLIPFLQSRGDYVAEMWGRTAIPSTILPLMDAFRNYPTAQSRTGRPLRLRWIPDVLIADQRERIIFAGDVKVKSEPGSYDEWGELWGKADISDDERAELGAQIPNIPVVNVELDSLYTMRMLERHFELPVFLFFYVPANGLNISTATKYHLLGCRAHDAWRDRRQRSDSKSKSESGGSGTPYVHIPVFDLWPHEQFDRLLFRGAK